MSSWESNFIRNHALRERFIEFLNETNGPIRVGSHAGAEVWYDYAQVMEAVDPIRFEEEMLNYESEIEEETF